MALPIINNFPWYDIVIPSTKKKVRFRPYNVGEQKTLLISFESEDTDNIAKSLLDIVINCIEEDLDRTKLTTFDVEYLFLQIRSKSVGEKSTILFKCTSCDHDNEVNVNIDDIKIDAKKMPNKKVRLNKDFTIEMKFPTYIDVLENKNNKKRETVSEILYDLVLQSLDKLHTEDELISFSDEPIEEIETFINNLAPEQYEKLLNFVNNLPRLEQEVEYKCENCGTENKYKLQGLYDFF